MSAPREYPYAKGELLEHPNTYFYSSYGGSAFVQAWRADRAACQRSLEQTASGAGSDCTGPTADRLQRWLGLLSAAGLLPDERRQLDALLRNFEAKKRLYADYHPGFNSRDRTDFHALCLYVRFAEVLVLAYRHWQELPYLNALLKCVDILCAERGQLAAVEQPRLAAVIAAEAEFVAALAVRLGVEA